MKTIIVSFLAGVLGTYLVLVYPNETKSNLSKAGTFTLNSAQSAIDAAKEHQGHMRQEGK